MSTGLLWLQCGRQEFLNVFKVSGESSASSPPAVSSSSVASTPGPPAFVTIVRRGPLRPRLLRQDLSHVKQIE